MSDADPNLTPATPAEPGETAQFESAGAMLRRAREAQGLDLDQLALLLKVPVRKLEALEDDRLDDLPGTAFVRGLAMSVSRQLGLDPQPVLGALPSALPPPQKLENVSRGLATWQDRETRCGRVRSSSAPAPAVPACGALAKG